MDAGVLVAARREVKLLVVAIQFLTRLPVPSLKHYEAQWLSQSARYFPLVGVLVGLVNVCAWWLASRWWPPAVSVGIMLAASLLVTGAFHEDGFADACDGFGGGVTRENVLAIMKDSRIGAYGAMGIFMILGLKWTVLVAMPVVMMPFVVVGAHSFSRWCATGLIWRLRYVRAEGKSKPLAESLTGREWLGSGVIGGVAVACLVLVGTRFDAAALVAYSALQIASAMSVAVIGAACVAFVASVYCRQRIGGYTGDCLGAVQQVTELAFLLGSLAMLHRS
jgi:adenosylcobinamide-GDP ribazoletransferase